MRGTVYFIRDGLGCMKIGISKDIRRRLKELQTANPVKLEYYYGLTVHSMKAARRIEKEIHEIFQKDRMFGEWFIEDNIVSWLRQPRLEIGGYLFLTRRNSLFCRESFYKESVGHVMK